jgi:hypothetical protein
MTVPSLTVLTTPVLAPSRRAYQRVRRSLRPLVKPGVPLPPANPYPGHHALTRSVVEGMRRAGLDFNYNPRSIGDVAAVVYAPANEALRQAVEWKREGRVAFVAAGPVNALTLHDEGGVLGLPEIDLLIVASDWVRDFYREHAPHLLAKMRVCPCGVDVDAWTPSPDRQRRSAVVYWKSGDESFCSAVEQIATTHGWNPVRVRYGAHASADFKQALDAAGVAVFLSSYETQGLALAEAWAMDVPTLVWDPQEVVEWRGVMFRAGSSAPYLTAATGIAWRTLEQLDASFACLARTPARFEPRGWVKSHMTDEICARRLFDVISETFNASPAGRR